MSRYGSIEKFFCQQKQYNFLPLFLFFSCNSQNNGLSDADEDDLNNNNSSTSPVPKANYELIRQDDFGFFDKTNWSKGLIHDADESIRMIWNKNTGGEFLLNDNYDGYLVDNNVYVSDGLLYLENRKEKYKVQTPQGSLTIPLDGLTPCKKLTLMEQKKEFTLKYVPNFQKVIKFGLPFG